MKEEILIRRHRSLQHTRCHFDIFNALSNWAVTEAGGKDKVFGTKPQVAEYTPTDLGTEADRAVQANIKNNPEIQRLLEQILPGWKDMLQTGSKNTLSLLKGEVPQDVQDSIRRTTAFKALGGGYGGSSMAKALTARDFGRTSLDLIEHGNNSAQRWQQMSQGAVAPFMVTGAQQADATTRNNLAKQAVDQFKFNVNAAPDPGAAGIFNLQTALGSMAASFGMSSALSGMGGGAKTAGQPNTGGYASGGAYGGGVGGGGGGGMQGAGVDASANYNASAYSPYGPWRDTYGWGGR